MFSGGFRLGHINLAKKPLISRAMASYAIFLEEVKYFLKDNAKDLVWPLFCGEAPRDVLASTLEQATVLPSCASW